MLLFGSNYWCNNCCTLESDQKLQSRITSNVLYISFTFCWWCSKLASLTLSEAFLSSFFERHVLFVFVLNEQEVIIISQFHRLDRYQRFILDWPQSSFAYVYQFVISCFVWWSEQEDICKNEFHFPRIMMQFPFSFASEEYVHQ